jgi:hypothetical protein
VRDRLILDLCAGTGSWSEPYLQAGYEVRRVDLPEDVRLMESTKTKPWGILAAPPCTMFCRMRMCRGKPSQEQFREALSVVDACLRVIATQRPTWWALENPEGYLQRWLGPPKLKFQPWEFGDAYSKKTWLWGNFQVPQRVFVPSKGHLLGSRTGHARGKKQMAKNGTERSTTPPGFAKAFFEANP